MGPGVCSETLEPLAYISQPCSAAILQHFSTHWEPKIPTLPQTNYEQGTQIVRTLWLAKRHVCMRVCKHGCDVKMFCFSHANHTSMNLKKVSSWKTQQVYFSHFLIGPTLENL